MRCLCYKRPLTKGLTTIANSFAASCNVLQLQYFVFHLKATVRSNPEHIKILFGPHLCHNRSLSLSESYYKPAFFSVNGMTPLLFVLMLPVHASAFACGRLPNFLWKPCGLSWKPGLKMSELGLSPFGFAQAHSRISSRRFDVPNRRMVCTGSAHIHRNHIKNSYKFLYFGHSVIPTFNLYSCVRPFEGKFVGPRNTFFNAAIHSIIAFSLYISTKVLGILSAALSFLLYLPGFVVAYRKGRMASLHQCDLDKKERRIFLAPPFVVSFATLYVLFMSALSAVPSSAAAASTGTANAVSAVSTLSPENTLRQRPGQSVAAYVTAGVFSSVALVAVRILTNVLIRSSALVFVPIFTDDCTSHRHYNI
jgi:hypothetical protein